MPLCLKGHFDHSYMFKPIRTTHPLIKVANQSLIDLAAPNNISLWWNYGSLLGLCLVIQTLTGIFLTIHYASNTDLAFWSIIHITRDVNYGWLFRYIHANGASIFFLFIYLHASRGIYYRSYTIKETWNLGVILILLTIATAFIGYVLPWGQISFWGATVITNLFSAIPYIGKTLVEWIWGGFSVDNSTLNRFFAFHFVLPFSIIAVTIIHILFLHQSGSNNPIGLNSDSDRVPFHLYYTIKDIIGYSIAITLLLLVVIFEPNIFTDPENFIPANPLVTPAHIKPEWYFLWVYAILRSIPNKLGGVVALLIAILILFMPPYTHIINKLSAAFYPINQLIFWVIVASWLILTWIGGRPVEEPFVVIGQVSTLLYFIYFIINPIIAKSWDSIILRRP